MKKAESVDKEKANVIDYYRDLQDLLISISTQYINADLSDIDNLIENSLQQMGEFVNADRSYVFTYNFIDNTTSNTHEWCNTDIEPEINNLQDVPVNFIQDWVIAHKQGKVFYVEDVQKLPKEEDEFSLRNILEPQGIKSLITIPQIKNNELIGFVGFDSVKEIHKYTEREKDILFVFANMLINIKIRKENEDLIFQQKKETEALLNNLSIQNEKLSDYAQMVSHDLKAPLINVHNIVEWFIEDNKSLVGEDAIKPLKNVLFNVEKMDNLIKGVLDYTLINREDTNNEKVNLNLLVDDILKILPISKNTKVVVAEKMPTILGNPWKIQQIFQNLIQNAIKYTDKPNGKIEIGYKDKDSYFQFFVKDNGVGINPIYFDKIFKAFSKLESESTSSGIGLSIVKRIVEFYNGEVWVESEEGKGATFYFTIKK